MNYREGISRTAEVRYVHKKQSGGSGQFADIAVRFAPGEPGTGFEFRSDIKGGVVPKEYIPGVTKVRVVWGVGGWMAGGPVSQRCVWLCWDVRLPAAATAHPGPAPCRLPSLERLLP